MNHVKQANRRREVALENIKKHLKNHSKEHQNDPLVNVEEQEDIHKKEISVLEDRIKQGAKYSKYLNRKPSIKVPKPATDDKE